MTACQLHERLVAAGCEPELVDNELVMFDPPPELERYVRILKTGLRSILSGRPWNAMRADGRGAGDRPYGDLLVTEKLPRDATYLHCEDDKWDRVHPLWVEEFPELFQAANPTEGRTR